MKRLLILLSLCLLPFGHAVAQDTSSITEEEAFEAVFADPGNILLNFQLASIQLKNGNIKEASGTLERILILLPSNAEAQSLLAAVQLRLGNKPEAERLSNLILENEAATASQKQEATAIIAQIEADRNAYNFTGFVSIGSGISDNPEGTRGNKPRNRHRSQQTCQELKNSQQPISISISSAVLSLSCHKIST